VGYRKKLWIKSGQQNLEAVVRNYQKSDFKELIKIQAESFPPPFPSELWWNESQLANHVTLFPDGALCIEINGELAGSMTGLIVDFDPNHPNHTWEEITDNGYIRNHNPNGNTLYVVDICIRPKYRKLDLGKWLMQSMYEVVVYYNLDRLLGGGRMPGFHKYANLLSAEEYLQQVIEGKVYDPVITFLLRCGRIPIGVVENYLEDDESCNYAALMEWKNPFK